MPTPDLPALPGLELLRPIGRGSFGEVWLARTVTGQYRAVKIIWLRRPGEAADHPELQALGERVFRGVQAYLEHLPPGSPTGLAVLHVDRDPAGRFFYYVMELADDVAGGRHFDPEHYQALTLSEFRRRSPGQFVPAEETIRLGGKLAAGLAALHAAGLVHRDIKPNNVVFIGGEPRLADIDLVRPAEASLSVGGAQGYSPLEGPGRPTADVFSLARTLYVTVTGLPVGEFPRLPEDWDQRPDAPALRRLNAVLLRAADRDPTKRHPNAAPLAEDLQRLERGEDVEQERAQRSRNRRLAAVLALVTLAATLFLPAYSQLRKQAAFDRYRERLNEATLHLERGEIERADGALLVENPIMLPTLESELLRRQLDDSREMTGNTNEEWLAPIQLGVINDPVKRIVFSPDGTLLVAAVGAGMQAFTLPSGSPLRHIPNISRVLGFIAPENHLVGIRNEDDGTSSIGVWDTVNGKRLVPWLTGKWIDGTVLGDGRTVVAFAITNRHGLIARWRPLDEEHVESRNWINIWNHPMDLKHGVSKVFFQVSSAGERMMLWENGHTASSDGTFEWINYLKSDALLPADQIGRSWAVNRPDTDLVSLSSDGRWIAECVSGYGAAVLWNIEDRSNGIYNNDGFYCQVGPVGALAVSSNGKYVALGGLGQVRLIDGMRGVCVKSLGRATHPIQALAWSKDESWLAAGDSYGEIRIWRLPRSVRTPTNQRIRLMVSDRPLGRVDLVEDHGETLIAAGNKSTMYCDIFEGSQWTHSAKGELETQIPLMFSDQGSVLWGLNVAERIVREKTDSALRLVDRDNGPPTNSSAGLTNAFSLSVDGAAHGRATSDGRRFVLHKGSVIAVWAVEGDTVRRIAESTHPNRSGIIEEVVSSDSRWAVFLADDGSALLANLDTGAARLLKQLNEKAVTACFRPNSTECYFGTSGGRLLRLDTATDDPPELLDANFGLPAHMIATPDGERLLTAGPGEQLGIRRLPDGAPIVQLTHHGLALEPGRHNLKRLLYLPKQQRVLSLSEDGWLTQW